MISSLSALKELKHLSPQEQAKFDAFYRLKMSRGLLPAIADFNIVLLMIGALFGAVNHILQLGEGELGFASFHPLTYAYWGLLFIYLGLNRWPPVRHKAPLMIYLTTGTLMLLGYRSFVLNGGDIDPIFGLYFYSAFLGIATASVKHTLRIQGLNLTCLAVSYMLIDFHGWVSAFMAMFFNWFVFHCLLMSITAAVFSQWVFRSLYASQYMLNIKNNLLEEAFRNLRQTEQLLVQQQKYQALSHMAKGLLHEVINPVNSASQAIAYARSINSDPDVAEALDDASLEQGRITHIVTDLRTFAQPDYNKALSKECLFDLISMSMKFCRRELDAAQVAVDIQVPSDLSLQCHPHAMTQVFVNLTLNAVAAMKEVAEERRVLRFSAEELDEQLAVVIRDTGKGIEASQLDRVLDPFYSDQSSPERMGLGLSICQTIVRHHGGSISIDSRVGEWTEFTLNLPYQINLEANGGGKGNVRPAKRSDSFREGSLKASGLASHKASSDS